MNLTGWRKVTGEHAESKGKIEALDELVLEIMALNHAESRQGLFADFENKFGPDGLTTETDVVTK